MRGSAHNDPANRIRSAQKEALSVGILADDPVRPRKLLGPRVAGAAGTPVTASRDGDAIIVTLPEPAVAGPSLVRFDLAE
ncbi:hypothetical protein LSHI6S_02995 [Leifsonia shinshuensis]